MKTITFCFFLTIAFFAGKVTAQTNGAAKGADSYACAAHDTAVKLVVDKDARFLDGDILNFRVYVMKNIVLPMETVTKRYQGKAIIKFIVDWNGKVKDVGVYKSSGHKELDDEAVRVIRLSPVWTSAKVNNICVPQMLLLPIEFRNIVVSEQ